MKREGTTMKKSLGLLLILCLALAPVCLAEPEPEPSSTDRFLSSLSETWGAFLDMAGDAGKGVSKWADESGVTEWVDGAVGDISAWAKENGLTDWVSLTLDNLSAWFEESGITEWASGTTQEIQAYIDENLPAIDAWLAEAGQEVRQAWDTLMNAGEHSQEEIEDAYETVTESLKEMS